MRAKIKLEKIKRKDQLVEVAIDGMRWYGQDLAGSGCKLCGQL